MHRYLLRIIKPFWCAIVIMAWFHAEPICFSSVSTPNQSVDDLIGWVIQTGRVVPLKKDVAIAMGVAAEDIRVKERGFRITGESLTHVVGVRPGVGPGGIDLYFFARVMESTGSGVIWLSSSYGKLLRTIFIDPSEGVKILSNEDQLGEFLSEREYFRRKMREAPTDQ
jgi:hypothetical protein